MSIFQGSTGPAGSPGFPGGAGAKVSHPVFKTLLLDMKTDIPIGLLRFITRSLGAAVVLFFTFPCLN